MVIVELSAPGNPTTSQHCHPSFPPLFNQLFSSMNVQNSSTRLPSQIAPLILHQKIIHKKWRSEKHGKENGETMFKQLGEIIEVREYNKENARIGGRAFLQQYEHKPTDSGQRIVANQPLVLAVCTPLMSRAHQLVRQAGGLVYCDLTSSLDRYI